MNQSKEIGGWRIFLYAITIWPLTIGQQPLMLVAPYYAFAFGLSLAALGAWMTFGRVLDVFIDLGVAYYCDRFRTRIGRKPWVIVGLIFFIPSLWLLFVPLGSEMTMTRYAIGLICFFLSWTVGFIPYLVHGTELVTAPAKRAAINVIQGAGNSLALIASYALPMILMLPALGPWRTSMGNQLAASDWSALAGLGQLLQTPISNDAGFYGLIMFVIVFTTTIITPILLFGYSFFVPDKSSELPMEKGGSVLAAFRNPVFMKFSIGYILVASAYFIALFLLPLQLNYRFLSVDKLLPLSLAMTITQIVAAPIWYFLLARMERHKCLAVAALVQCGSIVLLCLTPTGSMPMLYASYIAFGLTSQTLMMAPFLIASDAADYSRWKTGMDSRAVHIGLVSLMIKGGSVSGALFLTFAGLIGINSAQSVQTEPALQGLDILSFYIPAVMLIAGAAIIWTFPISRGRHLVLQQRIGRRSAAI